MSTTNATARVRSTSDILFSGDDVDGDLLKLHTELEAAEYFAARHGDDVRYCERAGGWLLWDGTRWIRDENGEINRRADETVRAIADSAGTLLDLEDRKRRTGFAIQMQKRRGRDNMLAMAQTLLPIAARTEDFDSDAYAFNAANGTVDLRSGDLSPHKRDDLLTKRSTIAYDAGASCPRWLRFLDEVFAGDSDLTSFLQRAVGYSLTGDTREQALFVLYGRGANGKSTLLDVMRALLGDYAKVTNIETFTDRKDGATNDLARLAGARLVSAVETNEGRALAEAFVKSVTGGDRIVARYLFREYFEFTPSFKIWLATNHKPVIRGGDEAIWRRIRFVPFNERFDGERRDEHLREKLQAEMPGILAWAVSGALLWREQGLGMAEAVRSATQSYRAEMDTFGDFLDACCSIGPDESATSKELFEAYRAWAQSSGEKPLSQRWLGLKLGERGFKNVRTTRHRVWVGLRATRENDANHDAMMDTHPFSGTFSRARAEGEYTKTTAQASQASSDFYSDESWPAENGAASVSESV